TEGASFRPGSNLLNDRLERGCFSLLHLAQALGSEMPDAQLDLVAICNDALSVAGEPAPAPEKATMAGPIRVIPHEMAQVSARLVDIRLPARRDPGAVAAMLLDEVLAPAGAPVAAWRDGRRLEQGLERVPLADDGMAAIPPGAV
ncbi:hypothetical protein, partial [Corallococcus exiguus]|uniref:hypothetical protein n=1 Tax=Corallococcus exiguus TaxID=83462 RepID=UPI001561688E